jgi:hypothetical protein
MTWKLKRTAQCEKCPWLTATDPRDIPNGYSEDRHRALAGTIAAPADLGSLSCDVMHVFACHETDATHCVGWLVNQIGPGNNIALRLRMRSCANATNIRLRGPQHLRFEDTLPKALEPGLEESLAP